ncbi:MAG: elongation factor Tu [Myxococcales bacterium]|nr:elongation factor Tu [Myxococcales bacterium]
MALRPHKPFERDRPHINVGTVGHIRHGKTTLTAALSARLARKGRPDATPITVISRGGQWRGPDLVIGCIPGYVEYVTEKRHYSHVDCPGHADYVKNALTGLSQMNTAIFVVSATDSVMSQSREHMILAKHQGVARAIVWINKRDLVDDETMLDLVEEECRESLVDAGFDGDNAPVLRGSALGALTGDPRWLPALDALIEAIDETSIDVPTRDEAPALLPLWNRYSIYGKGTVAIGVLQRGTITKGETLHMLTPTETRTVKALDVETYRQKLSSAHANDAIGVLLGGVSRYEIHRGDVVCEPESATRASGCEATITLLSPQQNGRKTPIVSGHCTQLFCGTLDVTARIELPESPGFAAPGDTVRVAMTFMKPMVFDERRAIILRESGRTMALGTITRLIEG